MPAPDSFIHLGGDLFNLTPVRDRNARPADPGSGYTISSTQAKFDRAAARLAALGFAPDEIMQQTLPTLCAMQACWLGHDQGYYDIDTTGSGNGHLCISSMPVIWPHGEYVLSLPLELSMAMNQGQGTKRFYGLHKGSTELVFDRAYWRGKPTDQLFIKDVNHGVKYGMGYHEGSLFDGFRIRGDNYGKYDPTKPMHCLGAWQEGEGSGKGLTRGLYIEGFNGSAIRVEGGVPFTGGLISAFNNALGAIDMFGSALATVNINTLSCDDNVSMVRMRPGTLGDAGGRVNINLMKDETAVTAESRGLWKAQNLFDVEGQFSISVGTANISSGYGRIDAAIVVNPVTKDGQQDSRLSIDSMIGFNYNTAVHDKLRKTRHFLVNASGQETDESFRAMSIEYDGGSGAVWGSKGFGTGTAPAYRLGILRNAGDSYNYVAGTPAYDLDESAPAPPPVCTWILGTPVVGPCINNVAKTTTPYVPSIAGCTPSTSKPADLVTSAACGTILPLWSAKAVKAPPSVLNSGNLSVKELKLTGVTFTFPRDAQGKIIPDVVRWINDKVWLYNTQVMGPGGVQLATVADGVKTNLDLTFAATVPKYLIGNVSGGVTMSADLVEYF